MNAHFRERMSQFRQKWSGVMSLLPRVSPKSTDEQGKVAAAAQRSANDQMHSEFLASFNEDAVNEIRIYLNEELRPKIVLANPQPLEPRRPLSEVDAELMNEYYFFRQFL